MAVGCWLRVGPLAVERMGGYGKATALAWEQPGAGGWIAYAASGGSEAGAGKANERGR